MARPPDPRDDLLDHLPALRAFAISLARNTARADDLVQDTVEKAWRHIGRFEAGSNMRAWLFTILRNTFYSERRKARRETPDTDGEATRGLAEKPAHDGHLALTDFKSAFAQLSDEQREVLILVGAQGFSYEEAARTCGVAVGTVKSRANRARIRLARLMDLDAEPSVVATDKVTAAVVNGQTRIW